MTDSLLKSVEFTTHHNKDVLIYPSETAVFVRINKDKTSKSTSVIKQPRRPTVC